MAIERHVIIKKTNNMTEEMQQDAIEYAAQAFEKYDNQNDYVDIATYITNEFDKKYNPTWDFSIGKNFACAFSAEPKYLIEFKFNELKILLFKIVKE